MNQEDIKGWQTMKNEWLQIKAEIENVQHALDLKFEAHLHGSEGPTCEEVGRYEDLMRREATARGRLDQFVRERAC